jgi:hypothetical protein
MLGQSRAEIIEAYPIGNGLDAFHTSFRSISKNLDLPPSLEVLDAIDDEGQNNGQQMLLY